MTDSGYPTADQGHPAAGFGNPTADYGHPSADQGHPSADYGHPSADQGHPSADQGHPSADQGHPSADQGHPSADYGHPTADQGHAGAVPDWSAPAAQLERPRRSWRPLALLVVAQLVAGVLAGLVWRAWSPSTLSYLLSGGNGRPAFVVPDESESQIAGDGRFVLLSIGLGMLFGLVAWRLRSHRGPLVLAALALAGVLSSLLARTVGELLPSGSPARKVDSAFAPQLSLHSLPALFVQAFFGVLVYTALVGLAGDPELNDR